MPLPYRTVLNFPADQDLVALAERQVQEWIESAGKVDDSMRMGFVNGSYFLPGFHKLADGKELLVVHADNEEDGTRRRLLRFRESSPSGVWQVDVVAIDKANNRRGDVDTLILEARRIDDPDAEGQVAPPRIIKRLLAEVEVMDGQTPVTSGAQLVRSGDASHVFEAITDPKRAVSVIVAAAPSPDSRELQNLRAVVDHLTANVVGTASVFVLEHSVVGELNELLPVSHQMKPGRVRTYMPGVDLDLPPDGLKHRILGPLTLSRALRPRNKVATYLQHAFAVQTRGSQLSTPLSRDLQRSWAALSSALAELNRTEIVKAAVEESRTEAPENAITPAAPMSFPQRLTKFISRMLGKTVAEPSDEHFDDLEQKWVELEAAASAMLNELKQADAKLVQKQEQLDSLTEEHDFRGLELADAERRAADLEGEARWLRKELAKSGNQLAFSDAFDGTWETPSDLDELVLLLTPEVTDRQDIVDKVVYVGDPKDVASAHEQDRTGLDTQRIWDFIHALHDYATAREAGTAPGNLHTCLRSESYDGFKVPDSRHVPVETEQTLNQWADERTFNVPGRGPTLMPAHFKSGKWVRLHYFDDTGQGGSGKIYVGYIGLHLTNTKTKNM